MKILCKMIFIITFVFCSNVSSAEYEKGVVMPIYDMPQELRDFFETADACEGWIMESDSHMEKATYDIIEDAIKES